MNFTLKYTHRCRNHPLVVVHFLLEMFKVLSAFVKDEEHVNANSYKKNERKSVVSTVEGIGAKKDEVSNGVKEAESNGSRDKGGGDPGDDNFFDLFPINRIKALGGAR